MAVSSYQSIMSSSMTGISSRPRVNQFNNIPSVYMPSFKRNASLKVRSMAEVIKVLSNKYQRNVHSVCSCIFNLYSWKSNHMTHAYDLYL